MSQDWFSLKELAGLPGIPGTPDGIRYRATKEQWCCRKRSGHGGGKEYHIDSLPAATKAALLDQAIAALPDTVCNLPAVKEKYDVIVPEDLPLPASLPKWRRDTMDARCQILQLVDQLGEQFGVSKAIDTIVARAKTETLPEHIQALIPVANARSNGGNGKQTLSRRTLFRWRDLRAVGTTALAPAEPAKQKIPAWAPYFLKCYQKPQKVSIQDALDELKLVIPAGMKMPSYSQANRFLKKMSVVDRERGRRSPKELKALQPYRQRSTDELQPLDIVQCDGHSFKARIAHPVHGKPFHPEVCACIDACTKLVTGWSAGLSETSETVADALRHSIMVGPSKERGGIPLTFYTDPGSGNKAKVNSDPIFGRYARLSIDFRTGIPGNSQARGLVERLQQSLWIRAAKQLETYTGKGMDPSVEHKNYRILMKDIKEMARSNMLPTWNQFLDLCQQAVDNYNNRPHRALPKITDADGNRRNMTPSECWDVFVAHGWAPDTATKQELDDFFRPRRQGTTRRGQVRLFGNVYTNKELQHIHGEKVFIEYEPQDGSFVYVRDMDEKLICRAEFEGNKSCMRPVSEIEEKRNKRADARAKLKHEQLTEIELERRGVVETVSVDMDKISSMQQQLIEAEYVAAEPVAAFIEPKTPEARINLYRTLIQKDTLTAEESAWIETFEKTPNGKSIAELYRACG